MTFNTRTTFTEKPVRLGIRLWGAADQCTMSQVPISIPWHREYWNLQLKAPLKPHSIKSSNTPAWPFRSILMLFATVEFIILYQLKFECIHIGRTGPCITNVFATRRKNSSQWHRSFQRKLRSHWLKFLRHVAITLVIQGPGCTTCYSKQKFGYGTFRTGIKLEILTDCSKNLKE